MPWKKSPKIFVLVPVLAIAVPMKGVAMLFVNLNKSSEKTQLK